MSQGREVTAWGTHGGPQTFRGGPQEKGHLTVAADGVDAQALARGRWTTSTVPTSPQLHGICDRHHSEATTLLRGAHC